MENTDYSVKPTIIDLSIANTWLKTDLNKL